MTSDPITRYLTSRESGRRSKIRLRPMRSNEFLDTATTIYQALGRPILAGTILSALCLTSAWLFVREFLIPGLVTTKNPNSVEAQLGEALFAGVVTALVAVPLVVIAISYSSAFVCHLVGHYLLGKVANPKTAHAQATRHFGKFLTLSIRQAIATTVGFFLSFLLTVLGGYLSTRDTLSSYPAVIVMLGLIGFFVAVAIALVINFRYSLAPAAIMFEGASAKEAIARSVMLLRSHKSLHSPVRVPSGYDYLVNVLFVIGLTVCLLIGGLLILQEFIGAGKTYFDFMAVPHLSIIADRLIDVLTNFAAIFVAVPIWLAATTILYIERRVRLEGFDIALLNVSKSNDQSSFVL